MSEHHILVGKQVLVDARMYPPDTQAWMHASINLLVLISSSLTTARRSGRSDLVER